MNLKHLNKEYVRCPDMEEIVEFDIFCRPCPNFNGLKRTNENKNVVDCSLGGKIPFK